MLKEREVLEEERQAIATRREEYLREVNEWEERLDTVGPSFLFCNIEKYDVCPIFHCACPLISLETVHVALDH